MFTATSESPMLCMERYYDENFSVYRNTPTTTTAMIDSMPKKMMLIDNYTLSKLVEQNTPVLELEDFSSAEYEALMADADISALAERFMEITKDK